MKYLGLIMCSLGVALATYPPYAQPTYMGGRTVGMSGSVSSSMQPGFNTQGFTRMQQPSYMLGRVMNSQPFSNSMYGRFMSGGASSGPSFVGTVVPTSTGDMGVVPRTRITTRYTVLPPGVGPVTSAFDGTNNAFGGMSGSFSSAPYMTVGMTGIAGGSPYMSGGIAGGSPYMSGGIAGGSSYMSGGIAGGSPYMSGGLSGMTDGSPYMAGGMTASRGYPMYNSFNINGVGGPSSMAYRSFGQSGGSSYYPYSTGVATGMGSFPQMSTGSFNSFGGPTSFGRGNAVGFSPMMHHKKRGAY